MEDAGDFFKIPLSFPSVDEVEGEEGLSCCNCNFLPSVSGVRRDDETVAPVVEVITGICRWS